MTENNTPAVITLRSSAKEIEAILKADGRMSRFTHLQDFHFERFVLTELETPEAIEAFLAELDADRGDGVCAKARYARAYYTGKKSEFWTESIERRRAVLAISRRVCCYCHETDSFQPRIR